MAQLLSLGILPQVYIYPKKDRPVRDLARKRMFLVQHKTAHILSLQSLIQRCCAIKVKPNDLRHLTIKELKMWLGEEYLVLSALANLDSINFLKQKIKGIEKAIRKKVKLKKAFHLFSIV